MRWFKTDPGGGCPALSGPAAAAPEAGIDDIRGRMLAFIEEAGGSPSAQVALRIRYAPDVETLWFLRGDLMALLANSHGEVAARHRVMAVTGMFGDLLPQGLRSRASPPNPGRGR